MEGLIFWVIFKVFGDILEDFWRTFEEFWRNWFVEEKIKNFRKVDNEPFWWPGGAPWGQIWAPPGGKVAMTYLDHAPKYQPNRPTNN